MTTAARLVELKDAMARICRDVAESNSDRVVTNSDVLKRVRRDCSAEISELSEKLVDYTLIKFIGEVSARKKRSAQGIAGVDLFGEIIGIPQMLVLRRGERKSPLQMTVSQLEEWLNARDTRATKDRNKGLKDLVAKCRDQISKDETVEAFLLRVAL